MASLETEFRDDLAGLIAAEIQSAKVHSVYYEVPDISNLKPGVLEVYVFPGPRVVVAADRVGSEVRITCYAHLIQKLPVSGARGQRIDELMQAAGDLEKAIANSELPFVGFDDGETGRQPYDVERLASQSCFATTLSPTFVTLVE